MILKADVAGSLEVIKKALAELSTDEVKVTIIHSGVGGINLSDIVLADCALTGRPRLGRTGLFTAVDDRRRAGLAFSRLRLVGGGGLEL